MKTHCFPYTDDDADRAPCGTKLGENSGLTSDWSDVTCGTCVRKKPKIVAAIDAEEAAIVEQMGSMAEFYRQQEPSHDNQ